MVYDLSRRITSLKKQVDEGSRGRVGFLRALFLSAIGVWALLWCVAFVAPSDVTETRTVRGTSGSGQLNQMVGQLTSPGKTAGTERVVDVPWHIRTRDEIKERYLWFDGALFGGRESAERYLSFAEVVVGNLIAESRQQASLDSLSIAAWLLPVRQGAVTTMLRVGFLVLAFWPYWLISLVAGYLIARYLFRPVRTDDMLGICDPQNGPYYSGIWAKFFPNNSISATDYATPGLASPAMVSVSAARAHPLFVMLREFGALNQTTEALVRVILAYKDYPALVAEERPADDETTEGGAGDDSVSAGAVVTADGHTVEVSAKLGLRAVLEAHQAMTRYSEAAAELKNDKKRKPKDKYKWHQSVCEQLSTQLSPLGVILTQSLTPDRSLAIAELPIAAVATAYLATEAGKGLVFDPIDGKSFSQISLFPHLQARAVLHSIPEYIREFNGDMRLQVRQAILSSRRHGDFGRAFLPAHMTRSSRALRDWLEILYTGDDVRQDSSQLVELDAHIDEIHHNWRSKLTARVRKDLGSPKKTDDPLAQLWLGIPYRSVVLMPLRGLLRIALEGIGAERQKRVLTLIESTRARQASLSIAAGLPGFKRQAIEAEQGGLDSGGVTTLLANSDRDRAVALKWLIIRRMLTRYNWLSTRVGDDAVPIDGLLQGMVVASEESSKDDPEVLEFDALVPLRMRRFSLLFGSNWEREFYSHAPDGRAVEVVQDPKDFKKAIEKKKETIKEQATAVNAA